MRFDLFSARIVARFCIHFALVFVVLCREGISFGQDELPATNVTSESTRDGATVPAKSADEFRFSVAWVSASGGYIYVPERWGDLRINLINAREEPRELLCSTYFGDQSNLQFGRRIWVPARSKLQISHPVVIPKCDFAKGRTLNLQTLVVDATEGSDVLVKTNSGQLLHDSALLVTQSTRNTGVIGSPVGSGPTIPPQEVLDLIVAGRVSQQLPNQFAIMIDTFLPADESGLNHLDHIVIAEDRIANDLAALSALRHWLHLGGHLWVMLDQASPVVLEKLLGDDFQGKVLDRVGLTTVRVDKATSIADPEGSLGESMDFEEPVDFVRMIPGNEEVTHLVNGWPAAMVRPYGDGRLLITTLGPRGWMTSREPNDRQPPNPLNTSPFIPTPPMGNIAAEFFGVRELELLPQASLEPQAREYIGYAIPSWGLIVGTLIGFSALLVVVAIGLLKSGRLESLGWIGSLMAVAVSLGLVSVGRAYRHGIPTTVATIQLSQAISGTDEVQSQGLVAVYHPESSQSQIRVSGGGRIMPEMSGLGNSPRRMVTTDLGKWHWENLPQSPGLRTTPFTSAEIVPDRLEARATLDANGIVGKLSGRLPPGTDALVATRVGRLGATLNSDGTFLARADHLYEKDQYHSSSLIDDEQDRRRRTLEKLLANPKRKDYPERPQLMFWSDRWGRGFEFADEAKSQEATLVAVPLTLNRPAPGSEFLIPSPLLSFRNRPHPDGNPPSTMWNYNRKEWQERSSPGTTWLKIQIPPELLPLEATRARIDMRVSGPVGRIEVMGLKAGEVIVLKNILDPVGSLSINVDRNDVLSIAPDGGLVLGISAGDPDRPELTHVIDKPLEKGGNQSSSSQEKTTKVNYWRIESLAVQLWAKTTASTGKD